MGRQICTNGQFYMTTLLHKDKFARRDIIAQRHFCLKGHFCIRVKKNKKKKTENNVKDKKKLWPRVSDNKNKNKKIANKKLLLRQRQKKRINKDKLI